MTPNELSSTDQPSDQGMLSFDPYSEPRTMPSAWDLSTLLSPPRPVRNGHSSRPSAASSAFEAEPAPAETEQEEWRPDPFPEPKTYPKRWDFNG